MLSVTPVLAHLTTLTRLELSTALADRHAEAAGQLAQAIGTCQGLASLQLHVAGLERMAQGLAAALPRLQRLTLLDLSSSQPGRGGVAWLAPCLPHLTALHTLSLSSVRTYASRDFTELCPALKALPSLKTLDLRDTGVPAEVAIAALPGAVVRAGCIVVGGCPPASGPESGSSWFQAGSKLMVVCGGLFDAWYE